MHEDIQFVENKNYNFDDIKSILSESISKNHHTNFGPVSEKLILELGLINNISSLSETYGGCIGSSATTLIYSVASSLNNFFNKKLRWIASDFGFVTNFIGALENIQYSTCDQTGMLSLDALKIKPKDSYDVILVTNVFGFYDDFERYLEFAENNNKILVLDNAAGFGAVSAMYDRISASSVKFFEIISLHHTKPWGVGEGGAVFAPVEFLPNIRSSINFGINGFDLLKDCSFCLNGKISELSCAAILSRVRSSKLWSQDYIYQTERIFKLGIECGLRPLFNSLPKGHVIGQVPFVLDNAKSRDEILSLCDLPCEKYYRPSPSFGPLARDLYTRMVNIPTHSEMVFFSDNEIKKSLMALK